MHAASAECRTGKSPKNDEELFQMRKKVWHEQGILVFDTNDDTQSWPDREWAENMGKKLYGKRRAK